MRRLGLSSYIFLALATTAVAPILTFALIEGNRVAETAREEADTRLRTSATALAGQARAIGEGNIRALETMAGLLGADPGWRNDVSSKLGVVRTRYGGFNFVYAADETGRSFAADSNTQASAGRPTVGVDYSDRAYLAEAIRSRRTAVSGVELGRVTRRNAVHVGTPVLDGRGAVIGILGGSLDLEMIQGVVNQFVHAYPNQHIHVIDAAGAFVAASDDAFRVRQPFHRGASVDGSALQPVDLLATGSDGQPVHASVVPVGNELGWAVITFETEADMESAATDARSRLLVVALLVAALALIVSATLARWLGRPISELAEVAEQAGAGLLAQAPSPRAAEPRETAILLRVFNEMLARTRRHTTELEETVAARTQELASANRALEQRLAELREAQARLGLADRMASVGTLAAGVGHEINNPMTFVHANLEYLDGELEEWLASAPPEKAGRLEEARTALRDAIVGARRVTAIVRDLRVFSRAEDSAVERVLVGPIIELCVKVAQNEIRHRARLEVELEARQHVLGNAGKLSQVFLNVIVNAAQAIEPGAADKNLIRVCTRDVGETVVVAISDTGRGIAPEHLARIFDPFFTTKPVGQGTGLGLAISQGIVASLGGRIDVESTPGSGTTITVALPAAKAEAPVVALPAKATEAVQARRIMAVDDEEFVLKALARSIGRQHETVIFTDPARAVEALERGDRFDAIFCDVMMPSMTGLEFHKVVADKRPDLLARFAFMTGGTFSLEMQAALDASSQPVLKKPFGPQELREVLARLW